MSRMTSTLALIALLAAPACSDDPSLAPDSGGSDGGGSDGLHADGARSDAADGSVPLSLAKGGDGHKDVGASLKTGEVRAGKVTAATQLLSGIKVEGRVGDFKIYNSKAAFIIQTARASDGWNPFGGEVVDAALAGAGKKSLLGELLIAVGTSIPYPGSVGVVSDGSDGKAALVRVIGEPTVVPYLAAVLGDSFGGRPAVHMVVDYVLEPDSDTLELRYRMIAASTTPQPLNLMILALTGGDGAEWFAEGQGFSPGNLSKLDFIGMVGEDVGYAFASLEQQMQPLVSYSGVWVQNVDMEKTVSVGTEATHTYKLAVTEGSPEAVLAAMRRLRKTTGYTQVTGVVADAAKSPVSPARVHVQKDDTVKTYVTMARCDAKGAYSLELAPGSYLFTVAAEGRAPSSAVKVTVGSAAATQDITMGGSGSLAFSVTDDASAPIPAKVVFTPTAGVSTFPASFGETTFPGGAYEIFYPTNGSDVASLPPGTYTVHASRGYEYEVGQASVTLADGEKKTVAFSLKRSVDTTGYMCGDFHLHGMWSQDSSDLYEFKLRILAAAGVELPVATDHEYITDYNPYIAKLGLQAWLYGVIGEELTTLVYGHFNPFPITQDPTKPNMGAMLWAKKTPPKLFADVRSAWPNAVFQVNHPRAAAIGGYFTYAGYDTKTGKASNTSAWSRNFDAFEVFNSDSFSPTKAEVLDFYSFLQRGFLVTGTGNSDSHNAKDGQVGWPRNYVKLSTDSPAKVSLSELAAAVKGQKVLMSGGVFVTVSVGGKGMGEVADAKSKKAKLEIKVQAPTWISVNTLRVIQGGQEVKTLTLDSTTADPTNPVVRYNSSVDLTPTADTWVIVAVTGSGSLAPVSRGTPFAMTNPVYLDVDGNGVYDAPLSF